MFSCEFCEIFEYNFFDRAPLAAASVNVFTDNVFIDIFDVACENVFNQ